MVAIAVGVTQMDERPGAGGVNAPEEMRTTGSTRLSDLAPQSETVHGDWREALFFVFLHVVWMVWPVGAIDNQSYWQASDTAYFLSELISVVLAARTRTEGPQGDRFVVRYIAAYNRVYGVLLGCYCLFLATLWMLRFVMALNLVANESGELVPYWLRGQHLELAASLAVSVALPLVLRHRIAHS